MSQVQTLTTLLKKNTEMLKKHLADFSDAEMLTRPVPNANHAAWQVSHLAYYAAITARLLNPDAKLPDLARLAQCHDKEAAKVDDARHFHTKAELLGLIEAAAEAQVAALATMSDADLEKPSPEMFRSYAPTMTLAVLMGPLHTSMHVGQIQVIRRKLGKPVLF